MNGHSKCDPNKEKCINQVNGYTCECQSGFIMNERFVSYKYETIQQTNRRF